MILLIDNYDSFVFNLARYLERLGQETIVARNDAIDVAGIRKLRPRAVVLSPGPCDPDRAGCSIDAVRELREEVPLLGICLGHQAIAAAWGAEIVRAPEPKHGIASLVHHDGRGEFAGLPNPFQAGRYHSLMVRESTLPKALEVSARTEDGSVMAARAREGCVVG
ncbi:MAG: aminodeoxychorismate/anthranilate synthase component II, partial [Planctomycetales bacterium]